MFWVYNTLLTLLAPLWAPWMWWRTLRRREKPNWAERVGNYEIPRRGERRRLWVHAVSVGEVLAALPILREIRHALPQHEIVLSVTTSSGHETARERAAGLFDHLVYFPIDVARFQLVAMQRVRPDVVVIMETELWFNFLWAAKTFGARTMLVNGRISDRSYPRSLKIRALYQAMLKEVDRCLMQTKVDAERIEALGAAKAEVFGTSKFDEAQALTLNPQPWGDILGLDRQRPTVVVGSLRAEEFAAVGPVLRELANAGNQIVVAPRHLERSDDLAAAIGGEIPRRSRKEKIRDGVLILDTYGELGGVYPVADVVVIGGGFADLGGQNLIQPLAAGKPVVVGPHMQNFREVTAMATAAGAAVVAEAETLRSVLEGLLKDAAVRKRMGDAALTLARANVGASARYARAIAEEVGRSEAR
ncbi:MAG: 3-deoxy-D-manno-octulosonic acid transferase [Fimbriimonas sp.]